jgi:hypothetical protein
MLNYKNKSGKLIIRLLALSLLGFCIVRLFPSNADQLNDPTYQNQNITDTSTQPAPMNNSDTVTIQSSNQNVIFPLDDNSESYTTPVYLDSGTVTLASSSVISDNNLTVHIPSSLLVDPRATYINFPSIYVNGDGYGEVCISNPTGSILSTAPAVTTYIQTSMVYLTESGTVSVPLPPTPIAGEIGNGSSQEIFTGYWADILNMINGGSGTTIRNFNGVLAGKYLKLDFISLSQPSTDAANCGSGNSYEIPFNSVNPTFSNPIGPIKLHS